MPAFAAKLNAQTTCSLVRRELQETMKTHLTMTNAQPGDAALHHRLERIELMLLSMQLRQEAQHEELMAQQEEQRAELLEIAARQKEHHHEVMSVLHKVLAAVRMQTGVLEALLRGDSECPRYMLLLPYVGGGGGGVPPLEMAKAKRKSAEKPSKCVLQFVDPVSMTGAGCGFELKQGEDELDECAPALGVALGALKMLSDAAADRRLGLALARPAEERRFVSGAYEKVKAKLAEAELGQVVEINEEVLAGTRRSAAELPPEYIETVQESYAAVTELLDRLTKGVSWQDQLADANKCGLVRAVHPIDGTEWVAARFRALYEVKGRAIIGMASDELARVEGGCHAAATVLTAAARGCAARRRAAEQRRVKARWEKPLVAALEEAHAHASAERYTAAQEREATRVKHERQLASLEAELNHLEEALRSELREKQELAAKLVEAETGVEHMSARLAHAVKTAAQGLLEVEMMQHELAEAKVEVAKLAGEKDELNHVAHKLSAQVAKMGASTRRR